MPPFTVFETVGISVIHSGRCSASGRWVLHCLSLSLSLSMVCGFLWFLPSRFFSHRKGLNIIVLSKALIINVFGKICLVRVVRLQMVLSGVLRLLIMQPHDKCWSNQLSWTNYIVLLNTPDRGDTIELICNLMTYIVPISSMEDLNK